MFHKLTKNPYLISLVLGVLTGIALPPFNSLALTLLSLAGFFAVYLFMAPKRPFLYSYIFGLGYFITGLYWIGNALLVDGNNFKWAWPFAVFALPATLSIFYGLAGWGSQRFFKADRPFLKLLILANSLMVAELARSLLFTGFPWNLLGTAWSAYLPTMQLSALIGLWGMTWLILMLGATLGFALWTPNKRHKLQAVAFTLCVLALNTAYGYWHIHSFTAPPPSQIKAGNLAPSTAPAINIITIQPNIPQSEKWDRQYIARNIETMIKLSQTAILDLDSPEDPIVIIWPETALSYIYTENPRFFKQLMTRLSQVGGDKISLVTGALTRSHNLESDTYNYQNALLNINAQGEITNRYIKSHLVPFGEYIPFQKYIPIKTVTGFTGFEKGKGAIKIENKFGLNYIPRICYEIIFPQELYLGSLETPPSLNAIIQVTNDGWYGQSSGPYQHNIIAQFRAVENGLYVLRSSNKGVSSIISPSGQLIDSTLISKPSYASANIILAKTKHKRLVNLSIVIQVILILSVYIVVSLIAKGKRHHHKT
tara:strand:+ start:495252 stop:496868 length:1617 start_codon:yes stop_codon:yes gene_type:complete